MENNPIYSLKDGVTILEEFGCYVKVESGTLFTAAINADDTCDYAWVEVTDPDPEFIKAVRFKC